MGDPRSVPGSWFGLGPVLDVGGTWGGEYTDGRALALNLSLPLSLSLPFKIKSIILR